MGFGEPARQSTEQKWRFDWRSTSDGPTGYVFEDEHQLAW